MCGISGIISFGGETDKAQVQRMTDALAHRGPDGSGVLVRGPVGLGHRRLSILDLSNAGAQPMVSRYDRHAITFNGEIYNFQTERSKLEAQGCQFTSHTDTEVLLQLYARDGIECLQKLRGMFAFAAVDFEKKEALIARDRLGKKPVYYFVNGNRLAFASELKALRTLPDCPKDIDTEALRHFLLFGYIPAPLTGIKGILKLPAAHMLRVRWSDAAISVKPYWSLPTDTLDISREEAVKMLDEKISDAVRLRLISDVPLGAFLSGGLDSSTVVAYMKRHASDVKTFSIGFKGLRSEVPDALRTAKHLGVQPFTKELDPDVLSILPTLVHAYDEPFGDPSCIPTYFLCQHAREHVTVALSGDGGDENFGGYIRYPILNFSRSLERLPGFLTGAMTQLVRWGHMLKNDTFTYRSLVFWEGLHKPWQLRMLEYMGNMTEKEVQTLARDTALRNTQQSYQFFADKTNPVLDHQHDTINSAMRMDITTYLADDLMPKVDRAAMAHGLEVRCPLLDHELVEFAARMPSQWKIKGKHTKMILKDCVRPLLPAETLTKKKQGFRLPMDEWFRGKYRKTIEDRLLDGHPKMWELLDKKATESFWKNYMSSHIDYSPQAFQLLWLTHWVEGLNS